MSLFLAISIGYFIVWIVSLVLVRMGVGGIGSWLAMLADSRHGRLLNFVALIAFLLLPLVYFLLCLSLLCGVFRNKRSAQNNHE